MAPGRIVVDRVSQRFRVSEQPVPHAQGHRSSRAAAQRDARGLGAARRLAQRRAGRGASASSAATARARRRCCGSSQGSSSRRRAGSRSAAAIGSLLELGAGFHPDFTGRENVYLNGSIHGLSRAPRPRADGRDRRLRRARALHRPAGAHVLVGDVHAARLLRRRAHRGRRAAARRGVRGRRRGRSSASASARSRVQAARRHDRLRLARRAGGRAPLRPRRAAAQGAVVFDGSTREAIAALPALLAGDAEPGRARRRPARVGERRGARSSPRGCSTPTATSAGSSRPASRSSSSSRVASEAERRRRRGSRSSCATTTASCSAASRSRDRRARLGRAAPASASLRFEIDRLPLADGRFHLRCALIDGGRRPPPALARRRGAVRRLPDRRRDRRRAARRPLDDAGDRRHRANRTRDELAHLPRLAAADGDRARAPVQALHAARGAAAGRRARQLDGDCDFDEVEICCDLESHVFYAEHTDPSVAEALRADALVRAARVGRARSPGSDRRLAVERPPRPGGRRDGSVPGACRR